MTARTIKAIALLAFAAFALIVYGSNAQAAPFVFAKVTSPAATKCTVTGASHAALNGDYPITDTAYSGQRGCLIDVGSVPTGDNSLSIAARSEVWGVLGVAVPFSFNRPSSASLGVELIQLVP